MSDVPDSPVSPALPSPDRGLVAVLGWACFLGCSWTWVIGMLWPILLVSEFSVWGWLVFAVPNVVGAAAMGFVFARPIDSVRLIEHHPQACYRFSEFTIMFHVFAVGWAFWFLLGPWGLLATATVALVGVMLAARRATVLAATAVATLVSLACLLVWATAVPEGLSTFRPVPPPQRTVTDLLLLAPNVALGFLLCPYLDLTFHRARQAMTPRAGRAAFALGFGVVFLTMIVFTLLYAVALRPLFEQPAALGAALPPGLVVVLGVHLCVQAGMTVALHLHELAIRRGHAGLHRAGMLAVAGGALAFWAVSEPELAGGQVTGQLLYRAFLLLYGLAFPAYVWLCVVPTRQRSIAPQAQLAVFAVTLVVTVPMAYWGFIEGESWWLLVALIVLGFARLVVEGLPRSSGSESLPPEGDRR